MKSLTKKIIILIMIFLGTSISTVSAYSDDLFKFDLPESYGNVNYQSMHIFSDSENKDRGMVIYAQESYQLKKSVWDIEQSDINKLVSKYSNIGNVISTEKRAKLGKEKAVNFVVEDDGQYMDIYILASNKYIYIVIFTGNSEEELNNSDYQMIKKSFKLKDRTTNFRAIYIIILIISVGFTAFRKIFRNGGLMPNNKYSNNNINNYNSNNVDYKNMTEEDFKNM